MEKFFRESKISGFGGSNFSSLSSSSSDRNDSDYYNDDEDTDSNNEFETAYVAEEDAIDRVVKNEAYCFDVVNFSEKFVGATLLEAKKHLSSKKNLMTVMDIVEPLVDCLLDSAISVPSESQVSQSLPLSKKRSRSRSRSRSRNVPSEQSLDWPKISEFNIKLGLEKLEDYVTTWKRSKDWLFCVEFLGFESEECSNIFVYEVEWSKPTNAYPIPQATASVYFALEVLKMVPYNYDRSIEVTYVFECSNVIHTPGKINFQEKWLEAIINAKLQTFKSLVFSVPKGICQSSPNPPPFESIKWK